MIEKRIKSLRTRLGNVDTLLLVLGTQLADETSTTILGCTTMLNTCLTLNTCNFEMMELIHFNIESVLNQFDSTPHDDIFDELRICLDKAMDILADMPLPFELEEATA